MRKSFLIIWILIAEIAKSQPPTTSTWFGLQVPVTLNSRWQWHNDAGYRTLGVTSSAYQYLYRTGVRYLFNTEWSVAAGATVFFTRNSTQKTDHEFGKEFRMWQELNFNKHLGENFTLQNRIRTEERRFTAVKNKRAYSAFRFRYRLSGVQKISEKWGVQLADEYMQQSVNGSFSFDQNRVMAAAIYYLNSSTQLQSGYIWQLRKSSSQHIITITFQKNISVNGNRNKHSS